MKPRMLCEHIIIPEKNLALVTVKSSHKTKIEFDRIIHAKRFFRDDISEHMAYLRFNRRLIRELTDEAIRSLRDAKNTHDKLEKIYVEAMDFKSLEAYLDRLCEDMFSCSLHFK